MRYLFTLGTCLLLSAFGAYADEQQEGNVVTLSLSDAIATALQESPTYKGVIASARAAEGLTYQSGLWENPRLFGQTEEWPIEESFEESRYFFGISQIVPFPGKKRLDRAAARELELSRKETGKTARIELTRKVRIAFYQVLASEKLVEVSDSLLSLANSSVETAKERFGAGVSTAQEVLRAEVQAERVKNAQIRFQRNLEVARSGLALVMGEPDRKNIKLRGKLHEEVPEEVLNFDEQLVLKKHPKALAAEALLRQTTVLKERAKLEPYPDITFSVAGGRREITDETLVDFGFSIPIPILNSSKGQVLAASENERRAKSDLLQVQQTLKTQITNEIATLHQAAQQIKNYRERLIPQSEKALRLVQTGFREGEYGFNDLLDTQRTVAEAKIEYLQALFALNKSIAEVKSLTELSTSF